MAELWLECRLLPFASGGAIHLLLLYDDVSQRRQMEQHLADALEFSRKIIQVSTMGIAVFNAEGRCILANEAVAAIVGGSVKAILQLNFYQLETWKDSGLLETATSAAANAVPFAYAPSVACISGKPT